MRFRAHPPSVATSNPIPICHGPYTSLLKINVVNIPEELFVCSDYEGRDIFCDDVLFLDKHAQSDERQEGSTAFPIQPFARPT